MITDRKHSFLNRLTTALFLVVFLTTATRLTQAQTVTPIVTLGDNANYFITDSYLSNGVDIGSSTRLEGRIPLLLVHGINAEADQGHYPTEGIGATYSSIYSSWANFIAFFNSNPDLVAKYKIYGFGYRSNEKRISKLGEDFGTLMRKLEIKNPELAGKSIVVLAHSMGGLVTREFMLQPQNGVSGVKWGERVANLITLATPHHGSPLNNNSKKIFGALGNKLPLSGALTSWELNAAFQLIGGADWDDPNRSDMWWDNYDNLFTYNFLTSGEQNIWLQLQNVLNDQYDSKIIAYAGTIRGYPDLVSSVPRTLVYTPGDGIIAELGFTDSDGAVPSVSALFDGHNVSRKPLVAGYDHSQMYLGQGKPETDPHFIHIGQDLAAIAVANTPPSPFTVIARGECIGTSSRILLTRSDSSGAASYQVFRNGQPLGLFATGSKEFRDNSVSAGTSYAYYVEASNASGQKTTSNTSTLIAPDCSAPDTVAPGSPINLSAFPRPWARNNLFYVAWNNPPDPSGISKVWFKLGSAPVSDTDGANLPMPRFNPFPIAMTQQEGVQTIYVWLEDGAGNKNRFNAVSTPLQLDVTPPTIGISSHPTSTPFSTGNSTITLSGNCADSLSGVANVTWFNSVTGSGAATLAGTPNSGTWTTTPITLYSGANTIKVKAVDNAGNEASTSLTVNYLDTSNSSGVTVTITPQGAIDQGAQWRVNGGQWRNNGFTEPNVPTGPRFVEFINIPGGYRTPAGISVNVTAGQNVSASGNYALVAPNDPPNTPNNPTPAHGAVNVARAQPVFSWSGGGASGLVDYAFFLSADSDPETNPVHVVGFGGVSGTSVPYPGTLLSAKTYSWRVKTRANGITVNGPIWRFTTEYAVADLAVKNLALDGNVEPGANVTLSVTVTNQGNFVAPLGYLYFYFSRVPGGKEIRLNRPISLTVYPLQPGQATNLTFSTKLDGLPAGQSFIDAWVDTTYAGATAESNFANNLQTIQLNYIDGKSPQVTYAGLSKSFVQTGLRTWIVYTATDDVGVKTMDFYYSTDDGLAWVPIQEGYVPPTPPASGGYFPWIVPANLTVGANLKIRVVARDTSGNWGEAIAGPYSIRSGVAPTVTVVSPNGGEIWDMGSQKTITWTVSSTSPIAGQDIFFYHDNTYDVIGGIPSGGATQFSWKLPSALATTTGKIRIRVQDSNGNFGEDFSDGFFSIRDTSSPPPAPWISPQSVATNVTSFTLTPTKVATDQAGNLHLVYATGTGYQYTKKIGTNWSSPVNVTAITGAVDTLNMAVDSLGHPHLIWNNSASAYPDQNKMDVYYTFFNGVSWSISQNLSDPIKGSYNINTLTWSGAPSLPSTAYDKPSCVVNGKLYVLGAGTSPALYSFDPGTGAWSRKTDMPGNGFYSGSRAVEFNGKMYVAGTAYDSVSLRIYNPGTDSWATGASMPTPRTGFCWASNNGAIYAIGGVTTSVTGKNEMYNPASDTWTSQADMPTPRKYAAAAPVGTSIYTIDGELANGNSAQIIETYDSSSNTWSSKSVPSAQWLRPKTGAVACTIGNRIYLCGGRAGNNSLNTVDEYDPASNTYQSMTPMQSSRAWAGGGVVGTSIYVVGGYDGNNPLASMEKASLSVGLVGAISSAPTIAIDSTDKVHVVWSDGLYLQPDDSVNTGFSTVGTNNLYYLAKTAGQAWSAISQLTTATGYTPALCVDHSNNVHLSYIGYVSKVSTLFYMKNVSGAWSSPNAITTGIDNSLRIAADGSNHLHMVWRRYNSTNQISELLYVYSDGVNSDPKQVINSPISSYQPTLGVDSMGRPHVTWEDQNYPYRLLYSYKSGFNWSSPIQLNFSAQVVVTYSSDAALSSVSNELHAVWISTIGGSQQVLYNHANVGSTNDIFAPSIVVNAPSSGQILPIGSTFNITWNAADNVGVTAVDLHLLTNNSSSLILIASNQANSGSFSWTVPDLGTNVAQVRVTARDAAGNAGHGFSGTFTTTDLTPPVIAITSPANGVTLTGGTTNNIVWTATDNAAVAGIDLAYSLNNGASWSDVATNLSNSGSYPWFTPNSATSVLLIRATAHDTAGLSASAITQPITIIRANTPPLVPGNPFPPDGSTFVLTIAPTLRWVSGDLDGDLLTYQIRFGTNSNPPVVRTGTESSFVPGLIRPQRTYYWQIIASDGKAATAGPMWTFMSEPGVTPLSTTSDHQHLPDGQFKFLFDGIFGQAYSIDASTNLVNWITVTNFSNTNGVVEFLDQAATNLQHRFYRVKER